LNVGIARDYPRSLPEAIQVVTKAREGDPHDEGIVSLVAKLKALKQTE
jgi:hypothetical protein